MRSAFRLPSLVGIGLLVVAVAAPADANLIQRWRGALFGFSDPIQCAEAYYHGNESRLAASGLVWACIMTMSETASEQHKEIAGCYLSKLPGTRSDEEAEQRIKACGG